MIGKAYQFLFKSTMIVQLKEKCGTKIVLILNLMFDVNDVNSMALRLFIVSGILFCISRIYLPYVSLDVVGGTTLPVSRNFIVPFTTSSFIFSHTICHFI